MISTYTISYRPEDSALVDIELDGHIIATRIPASSADDTIAAHTEATARREAKIAAYASAGMRIIRDASDMPRAARLRHRNRVAIITADGEILAHYANLEAVPELDEATTQMAPVEPAPTTTMSDAHYDAITSETRIDGYILTDDGATQIFDYS